MKKFTYDFYNSFYYRATRPIKRLLFKLLLKFNVVIPTTEKDRGVGKTYILIERALKECLPIVVGTQMEYNYIKRNANPVEVIRFKKGYTLEIIGKKFPNGVLIEESIDKEEVEYLKFEGIKIRGGFNYKGE
jgi:hypothetical protein